MQYKKYSHIIWDWNGTIFNDVSWCVKVINQMLAKRNIKKLNGVAEYQEAFCFPIIKYYQNVGFDFTKDSFEELAQEYIELYHSEKSGNCNLHDNASDILKVLYDKQIKQTILSASELNNLKSQMSEFDISHYFDEILGLSDIYAKSKIDVGLDYIVRKKIEKAILIGDTEHDFETATALGVDCLLISNGHQSKDKLLSCKVPILDNISQVISYIVL